MHLLAFEKAHPGVPVLAARFGGELDEQKRLLARLDWRAELRKQVELHSLIILHEWLPIEDEGFASPRFIERIPLHVGVDIWMKVLKADRRVDALTKEGVVPRELDGDQVAVLDVVTQERRMRHPDGRVDVIPPPGPSIPADGEDPHGALSSTEMEGGPAEDGWFGTVLVVCGILLLLVTAVLLLRRSGS